MSPVRIEPFEDRDVPAVVAFNRRLAASGVGWRFPETPAPEWLAWEPGAPIHQEFFLLRDGEAVRGAYILKHREASFGGAIRRVGTLELPLSEGTIDRAWAMVGYQLLSDALRRQPLLFGVGLGGEEVRIAQVLRALRWQIRAVPFHFKVLNARRFFRQIRYLRTGRLRSWILDLAAGSGMAWAGARTADLLLARSPHQPGAAAVVSEFDDWADAVWDAAHSRYAFVAARHREALNRIYSGINPDLRILRINRAGKVLGWAVVEDRQMDDNEYFGNLRVGTLMDALARPEDAPLVVWEAVQHLTLAGVDLVVSNQSHPDWCAALRSAGCLPGPSNFFFATAPQLARLLEEADPMALEQHVTRGDGPGPWGAQLRGSVEPESAAVSEPVLGGPSG